MRYEEKFLLRTRIHTITPAGIRTQLNSFFYSSDVTTDFDSIGHFLQYKSDLKLSDFMVSLTLLVLGLKGLTKDSKNDILFAISIILIASAIYWVIQVLLNLKYVGSFYFLNTTVKDKGAFEIKSKYPPSKELEVFMNQILLKKKEKEVSIFLDNIGFESNPENLKREAKYLKRTFSMSDDEFNSLINEVKRIHEGKADDSIL